MVEVLLYQYTRFTSSYMYKTFNASPISLHLFTVDTQDDL
jgi:hypothetical protein